MTKQNLPMDSAPSHPLPSGLIHDLRTPLNHIIGYAEMLIEQATEAGQEGSLSDLQIIRTAGVKLLTLIGDNFYPLTGKKETEAVAERASEQASRVALRVATQELLDYGVVEERASRRAKGLFLVVDDNDANRELLVRRLEADGYAAAPAQDGRQALDMLHADSFDLVLLDIMMPEVDGYEVLQRLKADERLKHIPVIMVSALDELESVARCIEMGADDYLPKPFNPTLLKARIGACLEKKRGRDREMILFDELQQNYKRLQELERLRDDLTHLIIHDLRTPLSAVIAGMQSLGVVGELNASQREVMGIAVAGGQTLLGIINELLDVEKLESGTMQLDDADLSAAKLVASAISQVASLAEEKQLSVVQLITDDRLMLQGDEVKLRRTLVNLLANAIKFTPSGGEVTISASQSAGNQSVEFSVSDTGEGIPAEAFERIFEKFGQVESRQGGRNMSTGLGLMFCKLVVEAHGGQIGVVSVLGKGSTFFFSIPSAPAPG